MYRTQVSDDVRELIDELVAKNGWEPVFNIKYYPGTEVGDGYASKHVAVDIIREQGPTVKLFVKYAHDLKIPGTEGLDAFYQNEAYFYDVVYPTFTQFLKDKGAQDCFQQVPKCYGTSTKNVIVLENLKDRGYRLFDRTQIMNEEHVVLAFKNFARYHAVSFAFKDQQKERYEELAKGCRGDTMSNLPKDSPMMKMMYAMIGDGLAKFDAEEDKHILDKCNVEDLVAAMSGTAKAASEYSVITKGDCWCNNMMFLYEKDDDAKPIDVMQVDWQLIHHSSLVHDLSYFYYTIASEEVLAKTETYLDIYYDELCSQIKRLGSDPEVLYPRSVFDKEWKQYGRFGFAMAFMIFKVMLATKAEVPQVDKMTEDYQKNGEVQFFGKISHEDEYTRRIRLLAEFMVDKDYL